MSENSLKTYKLLEDMGGSLIKGDWITVEQTDKDGFILVRHPHAVLQEPVKVSLDLSKLEEIKVRTTDEMDKTTPKERNELVGYCETDDEYTHYDKSTDKAVCKICGGKFSNWVGFQVESERTFNYSSAIKKTWPKGKGKRKK